MAYIEHVSPKKTHASSEKAREDQVLNNTNGYVFEIDDWKRLNRFLILGNEGGSYYVTEKKMTKDNFDIIKKLLTQDSKGVIDAIVSISNEGRAPKNAPAIFALAVCSVYGDSDTRAYANKVMPKVCRFSTDLYTWVNAVNELKTGKKGKGLQRAIGRWYNEKEAAQVAYQICKYPGRVVDGNRWNHSDLLKIGRFSPNAVTNKGKKDKARTVASDQHAIAFKYAIHGIATTEDIEAQKEGKKKWIGLLPEVYDSLKKDKILSYIWAHEEAKKATTSKRIVELIKKYKITRESIPNNLFDKSVWKALLPTMPMTALLRNLGQMTSKDVLKPLSEETKMVVSKLTDQIALQKARIHPMNVFITWKMYQSGSGLKGSLVWKPITSILDALEKAFYASFKNCEPIKENVLIGLDVSGSMYWHSCVGCDYVNPAEAAAIMSMSILNSAINYEIMAFSNNFRDAKITKSMNFEGVMNRIDILGQQMSSTNCSLPIQYAIDNNLKVDTFIILTDNETNTGNHPFQVLKEYRSKINSKAKLVVMAFESTGFTVADPSDMGMLDIAGLDSSVPQILSSFINGKF